MEGRTPWPDYQDDQGSMETKGSAAEVASAAPQPLKKRWFRRWHGLQRNRIVMDLGAQVIESP